MVLRSKLIVAASVLFVLTFAVACAGKIGPAGPAGPKGDAGAPGAAGKAGVTGPAGPAVGVHIEPAEIAQGKAMTLTGWGFEPGEAWFAFLTLAKDGPTVSLSGGEASNLGAFGAVGITTVGAEVNFIPLAVKPGIYLVTVEGSGGTKAWTTMRVAPAPTATPRPPTPTVPAAAATRVP